MNNLLDIMNSCILNYVVHYIKFEHRGDSEEISVFCDVGLMAFHPFRIETETRIYSKGSSEFDILMSFLSKINDKNLANLKLVPIDILERVINLNFGQEKLKTFIKSNTHERILTRQVKEELING